jgi:hypothetical protein
MPASLHGQQGPSAQPSSRVRARLVRARSFATYRRLPASGPVDDFYLPREVFFGRFGVTCAFFWVWASDLGRFFPATTRSFPAVLVRNEP